MGKVGPIQVYSLANWDTRLSPYILTNIEFCMNSLDAILRHGYVRVSARHYSW